jgi:glycosyltransferase AglD
MKEPLIEIVIPVRNESKFLESNIKKLINFLKIKHFNYSIIIAESNSQDNTFLIAKRISKRNKKIKAIHLEKKGRDLALKSCWLNSKADILAYMDADLSTDLNFFPELINSIKEGYDIAIGSRIIKGADVDREKIRKLMSKVYNKFLIPIILPTGVKDAQCGFKAITPKVAKDFLSRLSEENGFLDTELLAVAYNKGYKIKEIPVHWKNTRESTMPVWKNVPNFLKNIVKTRIKIIKGHYN